MQIVNRKFTLFWVSDEKNMLFLHFLRLRQKTCSPAKTQLHKMWKERGKNYKTIIILILDFALYLHDLRFAKPGIEDFKSLPTVGERGLRWTRGQFRWNKGRSLIRRLRRRLSRCGSGTPRP